MMVGGWRVNRRSETTGLSLMCMFTSVCSSSPLCPFITKEVPACELLASYVFSLFSLKQIGKQTFLAGRKLVEADTWGRRGTLPFKSWVFYLTQA